ncbi:hypothetical protein AVEN_81957-1 [Araneus ventricosus]|uniref:Uncharacterized protein n=1 Tax=Araneus ventricosus TaxID=182803 RepID=A0A4Y2IMC9_ARAVE|nr:hypothetical protein AVEN_81957-1 [Araneus ventricosus]
MYILQIFVLLCGLKKIFDQRIPDDWQNIKGIALTSSNLDYPEYFYMCYQRASTALPADIWPSNYSKKLAVFHFQLPWYAQQIFSILMQNEKCFFPVIK